MGWGNRDGGSCGNGWSGHHGLSPRRSDCWGQGKSRRAGEDVGFRYGRSIGESIRWLKRSCGVEGSMDATS